MVNKQWTLALALAIGLPASAQVAESPALPSADEQIASKLPKIPRTPVENPTDQTVLSWSDSEKSRYLSEARLRQQRARERVEEARELLKRAQSMTRSIVPSQAAYGETTAQFSDRQAGCRRRESELLKPFEKYLADCEAGLSSATAVLDACTISERGLNGGWTPIGR